MFYGQRPTPVEVDGNCVFTKHCSVTKQPYTVSITKEEYYRWHINRELIQNVLPHKSAEEREFIISGMTPAEWNEM